MNKTFTLEGMTCGSCESKVSELLKELPEISNVIASKDTKSIDITFDGDLRDLTALQKALGGVGSKYTISNSKIAPSNSSQTTWFKTYKPLLIILFYILLVSVGAQYGADHFDYMIWMRHFMAGFFIVFSFFKLLDLTGFSSSYSMYDIVAQRFFIWGYIYPFVELALGVAFLLHLSPILTNVMTLILMLISIVGVIQSVLSKKQIRCACLGTVFNLPMTTVTIIEDGVMIVMSAFMLIYLAQ